MHLGLKKYLQLLVDLTLTEFSTSLLNFIVDITYCQVPNFSDKAPIGFITSGFMKLSVILECGKIEIITA